MPQKLRAHLIASYLAATDSWLQAEPSWRWETLTSPTDPAVDLQSVVSAIPLLCTILQHVLRIPCSNLSGPIAPYVRPLRASLLDPSHLQLGCGALACPLRDPAALPISIVRQPLGPRSGNLSCVRLPGKQGIPSG